MQYKLHVVRPSWEQKKMEDNGAVVQTGNAADRRSVAGFCSLQVKQGKLTLNIIFSSVVCLSFAMTVYFQGFRQ